MNRLVYAWDTATRQDVGAWRHPHAPNQDGGKVRENVAKQVAGKQDIERGWRLDHAGGHGVDQNDLQVDGRVLLGNFTNNPFEFDTPQKAGPAIAPWPVGEAQMIDLEFEGVEQ